MVGIYFSGTGNTKYCLEQFVSGVDCSARCISIEDSNAVTELQKNDVVIFAYPIYYSNLPKIVRDFIVNNHTAFKGKNIFIIATMGLFSGDGAGCSARLLAKYGAHITGGLHLKMPDCIGDEKVLKKTIGQNKALVKEAQGKIKDAAGQFKANAPTQEGIGFLYHMAGFFGQRLWFYNKTKSYSDKLKIPLFIFLAYLLPLECILLTKEAAVGQIGAVNFLLFGIEAASPTIAAIIVILLLEKKAGIKEFFRLNFTPKLKLSAAIFPIIIAFLIMFAAKFISCLLLGIPIEIASFTSKQLIIIAWAFVAEEIGWRGFLTKKLMPLCPRVLAPLLVGLIWAFWHYHFFIIGSIAVPIPLFIAGCVVDSYLYAQLLKISNGNILIAMLFHPASNFFINLFLINPDVNGGSPVPYAVYVVVSGIFVIGMSAFHRYRINRE